MAQPKARLFGAWILSPTKKVETNSASANGAQTRAMEPGKGHHSAKWDRCVNDVKKKGSSVDPYAVCTTSVGQAKQARKSPTSLKFLGRLRETATTTTGGIPAQPGRRFRAVLLQEGLGNLTDCYYYTKEAIASCPELFEGKKFFIDHPDALEEKTRPERSVRDVAGWFENCSVEIEPDGRSQLVADLVLSESPDVDPFRIRMLESLEYTKNHPDQDFVALSINAGGDFDTMALEQFIKLNEVPESCLPKLQEAMDQAISMIRPVSVMTSATSCDLVTEAGAGGKIAQLLERERGTMATKVKESKEKEKESKEKKEGKKESHKEDGAGAPPAKDGGADGEHADADQDEELIQSMMKKYLGDGFTEDDHKLAHEAYQHAMEACEGDHDEAMKMAGYNLKMAKHIQAKQAKGNAQPPNPEGVKGDAPAPGQEAQPMEADDDGGGVAGNKSPKSGPAAASMPADQQESEKKEGHKESAKGSMDMVKLVAENARLRAELDEIKLGNHIDKTLMESGLPRAATKKFRESCLKGIKTQKAFDETFATFREAWTAGAGEGDGFGFVIGAEKSGGQSAGGLDFSDCKSE